MSQPFHLPSSRSCFLPSSNEAQGPDQAAADHLSPGKALWLKGRLCAGMGRLGVWDEQVYTALKKNNTNKALLYSTENSAQYSLII